MKGVKMSVARAREVMARLRAAGITVHEQTGWETRGNGQTSAYQGFLWHHTATSYSNSNLSILVNGRSDLSGPLCNTCGWEDGSVGMISANPANHAGASGGYNTAPLPTTSLFNKLVWGHEIIYPGDVPMTAEQYRTATILGKICTDVFGYGDINRAKGHAETSITGKWDPGFAPSRTYDLNKVRTDSRNSLNVIVPEGRKEMGIQVFSYDPTYDVGVGEAKKEKVFVFAVPAGRASQITKTAWISVKSGFGPMDKVRIQAIAGGRPADKVYVSDKTWTNVPQDTQRPGVAVGGDDINDNLAYVDQFTVYVTSAHEYSIVIETEPR